MSEENMQYTLKVATPEDTAGQPQAALAPQDAALQKVLTRLDGWGSRLIAYLDKINQYLAPVPLEAGAEPTPTSMARQPILIGGWMFIILFGIIGMWAALAPIASAALAPGKVILSGNKKTLQHLEGGVVDAIYVREGQAVKKGEPLIRLNETAARARMDLYGKQYVSVQATVARLLAERDNLDKITFPEELLKQKNSPEVADIIDSQLRLFNSRRDSIKSQEDIILQKKAQYANEIDGLNAQIQSADSQIGFLQQEINAVSTLLKQGNASRPRLLALQRNQAELRGRRGEAQAMISKAEQAIAESDLEIVNLRNDFANKIAAEYKENADKAADLQERIKASVDIMDRIIIAAPLSGIVTDLKAHTIGGVIRPGEKVMDIVPTDELIIEARVSPQDIDVVHAGQEARVRLTAYRMRTVSPVEATVESVSADRFEDPNQPNMSYYLARVQINAGELENQGNLTLTPGMPADVMIINGSRSMISYLLTPIMDSFHQSFREQ